MLTKENLIINYIHVFNTHLFSVFFPSNNKLLYISSIFTKKKWARKLINEKKKILNVAKSPEAYFIKCMNVRNTRCVCVKEKAVTKKSRIVITKIFTNFRFLDTSDLLIFYFLLYTTAATMSMKNSKKKNELKAQKNLFLIFYLLPLQPLPVV